MTTARPGTFLLVDDSPLTHQMYRLVFSRGPLAGSTLLHAMNGREGYGLFAAHPEIVLVLLDLNMPEMNGLEFLERRRAEGMHPDIPVVLVTALEDTQSRVRGIEAGADDFLSKPVKREELVARVQTLRRLHETRKELESRRLAAEVQRKEAIRKAFSRYISPRLAERIAEVVPSAQLIATEGNGHTRLLRNAGVIADAASFLRAHPERAKQAA